MSDLISRQAAIDALFELYEYQRDIDPTEAADLVRQGIYLAEKKVEQLPSAERKGKWIHDGYDFPHGNDWIHCSECGKRGINVPADLTNFCPNCGADMRGEEHEDIPMEYYENGGI